MIKSDWAQVIANIAIFLEYSTNDVINEDASIEAMEQLAADLRALDGNSRRELALGLRCIASSYNGDAKKFVENLPDILGI